MILSALLISLLLALGGALRWGLYESRAATLAQGQVDALTTEVKVLDERLRALPAELERQREKRKEAGIALDQNPEWRDAAVPQPVADGLCKRLRCASVHPVPAPNR